MNEDVTSIHNQTLSLYSIGASEQGLCRDAEPGEAEAEERLRSPASAFGHDQFRCEVATDGAIETAAVINRPFSAAT